jgi:hypothetical protein
MPWRQFLQIVTLRLTLKEQLTDKCFVTRHSI